MKAKSRGPICDFTLQQPRREPDDFHWKDGIVVRIVRHPRARRYLLRLQPDGLARLVMPRRGSRAEALRFLERNGEWLVERFRQWKTRGQPWIHGTEFLYRGERIRLRVESENGSVVLRFGDQTVNASYAADYRDVIVAQLRQLAKAELPMRTRELADEHGIEVPRITIRAQKTRWGSCSSRGTISLNWRLVQAPPLVRDYLIVHELMHRREMNHSARYWKLVEAAFPEYRTAEKWLKQTRLQAME